MASAAAVYSRCFHPESFARIRSPPTVFISCSIDREAVSPHQPMGKDAALDLAVSVGRAADAVEALVSDGLESAQQRFNRGATSG